MNDIKETNMKYAHIIGFMSGKGGVGKTSLSVNIANFCADNGAKVLLIDCDFNTHGATTFFSFDKNIEKKINGNEKVVNFQKILTSFLNKEKLNIDINDKETEIISINDNFDFIPAGFKGKVFEDAELTENIYLKLTGYIETYFEQWRQQYDLILLDFCAGCGDINNILSQFIDNICIVMKNDEISRKAVRTTLSSIFRERDLDEIICCVNIVKNRSRNKDSNVVSVINTIEGFENLDKYENSFNKGQTLSLSDDDICTKLCEIISCIWKNNIVVANYEKKIEEKKAQEIWEYEEWEKEQEETESIKQRKILEIRLIIAIVLGFIVVPIITLMHCIWWIKLICIVIVLIVEWLIVGRGRLYAILADAVEELVDIIRYEF